MADSAGLFDFSIPIIQAPMAGVSTPALAAANGGGLGSLGIGASPLAEAHRMLEEARALTNRPININVFSHQPAQRDGANASLHSRRQQCQPEAHPLLIPTPARAGSRVGATPSPLSPRCAGCRGCGGC